MSREVRRGTYMKCGEENPWSRRQEEATLETAYPEYRRSKRWKAMRGDDIQRDFASSRIRTCHDHMRPSGHLLSAEQGHRESIMSFRLAASRPARKDIAAIPSTNVER